MKVSVDIRMFNILLPLECLLYYVQVVLIMRILKLMMGP